MTANKTVLPVRQVCSHLDRLSADLEAAAHPALDDLTAKVLAPQRAVSPGMLFSAPQCAVCRVSFSYRCSGPHVRAVLSDAQSTLCKAAIAGSEKFWEHT